MDTRRTTEQKVQKRCAQQKEQVYDQVCMVKREIPQGSLDNGCNKQGQPVDALHCNDARDLLHWLDFLVSLFNFMNLPFRKSRLDGRHCSEGCYTVEGYS